MRDGAVEVYRTEWGVWRADIPPVEASNRAAGWIDASTLPMLLGHVRAVAAGEGLRVEVWDSAVRPGGWVCGWAGGVGGLCGTPVEEGPCAVHHPQDGDLGGLLVAVAEDGRHPLGRQGMAWLGVAVAVVVLGLCLLGTFLAWRHR